ncbi:Ecto-NOX disulfide-thiol exchanger 1 [Labeo rohita]|uniref:Ecto-NOX disulfide-thiol exchanger 1 n=1 Tax=Labeo rohita TaxID=84645 RepID=A0ABQ8MC55_LABRO|nr:Ecto-NOX disulfide-thiol exchanger 1 [Labeo rohita]
MSYSAHGLLHKSNAFRSQILESSDLVSSHLRWSFTSFALTSLASLWLCSYGSNSICIQGFDPNLGIITPINPMMAGISLVPPHPVTAELPVIKEIIHCKSCTLFPQNPNLPPPSTRERPPGCKTVFVGGLPENATEEIIKEVFDQCGEIVAIRKSKKNFCHIRFIEEFMVDKALYLSGYRMRIGSSTDKKDSGRIHVDFAQARDDLYEWECKQRLLAREERHRRKIQEERLRPPSPPPIMHYSEHEAALLAEKLKAECGKMTYTARSAFLQTFRSCPQLISDDVTDTEWLHSFETLTLQSFFPSAAASRTAPAVVYSVRLVCLYDQLVPFISFNETNDCQ